MARQHHEKMRGDVTIVNARVMIGLHKLVCATTVEVGKQVDRRANDVNARFVRLVNDGFVIQKGTRHNPKGGRPLKLYALREDLAAMSAQEFEGHILDLVNPKYMQEPERRQQGTRRAVALMQDPQKVELLRLNAPYLPCIRIAQAMGERSETVAEMAELLDIPLGEDEREPRALDVAQDFQFIPTGARIGQWLGGTTINLPSQYAGIKGVTRHYGLE